MSAGRARKGFVPRLTTAVLVPALAVILAGLESFARNAAGVSCGEIICSGQALSGFQTKSQDDSLLTAPVSFSAAPALETRPGQTHESTGVAPRRPRRRIVFLGIGDGIYNTADPRWTAFAGRKPFSDGPELQRLPGASAAMEICATAAHASRVLLLQGRDCSRSKLQQALRAKPNIIFIGTHIVSYRGERAIELGINSAGRRELLTSADIRRFHVPRAIVTMAGCGSAAEAAESGGGLMGAWLAAGARAVIGTRSPLPDARGQFPAALYAHLLKDRGPGAIARALHNASLDASHAGLPPDYSAAWVAVVKER